MKLVQNINKNPSCISLFLWKIIRSYFIEVEVNWLFVSRNKNFVEPHFYWVVISDMRFQELIIDKE